MLLNNIVFFYFDVSSIIYSYFICWINKTISFRNIERKEKEAAKYDKGCLRLDEEKKQKSNYLIW